MTQIANTFVVPVGYSQAQIVRLAGEEGRYEVRFSDGGKGCFRMVRDEEGPRWTDIETDRGASPNQVMFAIKSAIRQHRI